MGGGAGGRCVETLCRHRDRQLVRFLCVSCAFLLLLSLRARVEYRRCFGVGKRAEGVSTRVEYRRCFRGGKERKGGTRLSNIAGALPRLSPSVSAPVLDGRWRDGGEGKHVCRISPVLACRFYVHPHECVHDTNTMHA